MTDHTNEKTQWKDRAEVASQALLKNFWNEDLQMFNNHYPNPDNRVNLTFHYWWYAHALDSLVDAYLRTDDKIYTKTFKNKYDGLVFRNGGQATNLLYDDMEWLAIALLRAYNATNRPYYAHEVNVLWEDIKGGWDDQMGGGISWHKDIRQFKNTPANAPAIILATRLYQTFGKQEDLDWALKIFNWLDNTLVDADTGYVSDGANYKKDGKVDQSAYTYNQGIYIGSCVELYKITQDETYITKAILTAKTAIQRFTTESAGVFKEEGIGDGGLFKGIMVRYMSELVQLVPEKTQFLKDTLLKNAETLWESGRDKDKQLFNKDWATHPVHSEGVSLSVQLSGLMLIEQMAVLEGIEFK